MESSSAQQLGLQLDNSIFQSLQLNLVNLVSGRGIQIPRLALQRTFTENKKIYSPNLSSQNRRKILVRPLAFLFPCSSWAPAQPTILNQNQSPLASLATHSTLRGLDHSPPIQWGVLITFVKRHFAQSSKIHARRCIETFTSEDKDNIYCCVLFQAAQHSQIQLHHSTTAAFQFTALD